LMPTLIAIFPFHALRATINGVEATPTFGRSLRER
jgi:hypothetical protein